jgi:hypothetical protein
VRLDSSFYRSHVEAWGTIDAIAIEHCHCGHLQFGAAGDQVLRQGRAFEEAEGGTGMELNIHRAIWSSGHLAI